MKEVSQRVCGLVCTAIFFVGLAAGQTAPVPNETKSTVQGKVIQEPGGQGIRKAKISLRGSSGQMPLSYEGVTDETGQFTVEGVEPGTYVVQLERPGYSPDQKANRDRVIKVIAGQDAKDFVFHMRMAGVISGKIVDLDGDPIQGVGVTVVLSGGVVRTGSRSFGNAVTNDLGEYRIADLPPGKYIVHATPPENRAQPPTQNSTSKEQLAFVTTYFPGTLDERQATAVDVVAGATASANFGMQMSHVYRVTGTILGLSSPPRPQSGSSENPLEVLASQTAGQLFLLGRNGPAKEQNVSPDGKFEFSDVLAGTYRVQFISFSGFFSGQSPSIKMQTIRTPIEVSGADVIGLQLQLEPGGDVSGKFRNEGDEKIDWKGLQVHLAPVASGDEQTEIGVGLGRLAGFALVKADGSFEMKDVPPATYQLGVSAHSAKFRDYYTKSVLLGGRDVADSGFEVTPGTMLDVVISAKGAAIEGTVVDDKGNHVADATVVSVPSSGKLARPDAYQFARTDESGHFLLRGINPGEFLVLAFDEMQENYRTPEFARNHEGKGEKVELEEGGKKSVVLKLITE